MTRLESLRVGAWPVLLYGLLALLSFPTLGHLVAGQHAVVYALDVFELPRTGMESDWLTNGLTLWNTHLTSGNALFAQQSNSPFAIDVALTYLVGPFAAYVVYVWLMAAVAGLSMHLFLRDSLRLSTFAVLVGAVIYMFGFWHYIYGIAAPAIPLLLWLMDRAVVPGPHRWRFILAGSLVGGVVLYHALSQVVLIVAAVQLVYLVWTASDRRGVRSRVLIWGGTWILALCLYGPLLVSQLVMLPISVRAIWGLLGLYDPTPVGAFVDTVTHYSQVILGVPMGSLGVSPARYGTYFLGAVGLPLLVLGIVGARRDRRGWFLLALLLAIPAWDLIAVLLAPVQQQLGFLKSFQMDRIRHMFPFVLVANAAFGADLLARTILVGRPLNLDGRWRWRWAAIGASLIPLLIAAAVAARQVLRRRNDLVGLEVPAIGWALLSIALVAGLACLGLLAIAAIRARDGRGRALGAVLVGGLLLAIAGERVVYAWGERWTDQPAYLGTWDETLGVTPAKAFLLDQPGIDRERVLSFGGRPNQMAAAGMLQVDGYQSIYPVTYHAFFGALIAPALAESAFHTDYYGNWGNRTITFGPKVDPELVALSGARWLYVIGSEVPTVPGIVARFTDGAVTVYEVPSVLPRAFVAGALEVGADQAAVIAGLAAADLDRLLGSAYVAAGADTDRLRGALGSDASAGPAGTAAITEYTPDRVTVDVHADRAGVLILTDVMAPGWIAERDGTTVPIATVDATFRGVAVDASTRRVVFRYAPGFTYVGFALAGAALMLSVAWALVVRRRDRSAPPAPPAAVPTTAAGA